MKQIGQKIQLSTNSSAVFLFGMAVILSICLIPRDMLPNLPISDKEQHIIAFSCWTLLVALRPKRQFTYLCLAILSIGAAVELLQLLFHRNAELSDVIANIIGVSLIYLPIMGVKLLFGLR